MKPRGEFGLKNSTGKRASVESEWKLKKKVSEFIERRRQQFWCSLVTVAFLVHQLRVKLLQTIIETEIRHQQPQKQKWIRFYPLQFPKGHKTHHLCFVLAPTETNKYQSHSFPNPIQPINFVSLLNYFSKSHELDSDFDRTSHDAII